MGQGPLENFRKEKNPKIFYGKNYYGPEDFKKLGLALENFRFFFYGSGSEKKSNKSENKSLRTAAPWE